MQDPDLAGRLREVAARIFAGRPVLAAYAYGSRICGRARPDRDLDVGYYLKGYSAGATLAVHEQMRLAADATEALGMEVDLRNLAEAPLELRGRILEDGIRIYSKDDAARVALERNILTRYHDYRETFRRMHDVRLRALAGRGARH